jgi:hypothetical protein
VDGLREKLDEEIEFEKKNYSVFETIYEESYG